MSRLTWRFAGYAALWAAAMTGVLQLRHLDTGFSHAMCGPWGCAPPVEALAAYHGGWLVMLSPLVGWLLHSRSARALKRIGNLGLLLGAAGLFGVGLWLAITWYPSASETLRPYALRVYVLQILSLVDVPLLQFLLFGVLLRIAASRKEVREVARVVSEWSLTSPRASEERASLPA